MGTAWKGHRTQIIRDNSGKAKKDSFEKNTVFTNAEGGAVHLSTPGHKFEEIIEMYNATCENEEDKLPRIRLHDLRHTSATLLLAKNCDIETISHRLGHSKASVTLDIYGHATKEADREAAKTLEALLG